MVFFHFYYLIKFLSYHFPSPFEGFILVLTSWTDSFLIFKKIFYCGKINIMQSLPFWPLLSVQFCDEKYIHTAVPLSLPSISRTFSSFPREALYRLKANSLPRLPPKTLATTTLLPVFMASITLGSSYKWNHTIFILCDFLFHLASCLQGLSDGVRISFLFKAE